MFIGNKYYCKTNQILPFRPDDIESLCQLYPGNILPLHKLRPNNIFLPIFLLVKLYANQEN